MHLELPVKNALLEVERVISGFTGLQSLFVHGSNLYHVVNLPHLKKLIIRHHAESSIEIKGCPMLETLKLLMCNLTNWSFLEDISSVQHLTIQRNFGDETKPVHYTELADNILKHCRNIKTLRIDRYLITADDLERFVYQLPKLKKIVILNRLYDEKLVTVAMNLQANKKDIEILVPKRKFIVSCFGQWI